MVVLHADDDPDLTSTAGTASTFQRQTGNFHFATQLDLHTATAKILREGDGFECSPQLPLVEARPERG